MKGKFWVETSSRQTRQARNVGGYEENDTEMDVDPFESASSSSEGVSDNDVDFLNFISFLKMCVNVPDSRDLESKSASENSE